MGSPASGRPAVLIVDDNHANRVAMEALLASLDLDVAGAQSGEEALKQLLDRDFAVVLMDVQMPGMDGFQTTQLIRQRDRTRFTPIIFVTAIFTDTESEHKAYALGALDFVTKPFDEAVLRAKVAALVGRYQQSALIEQQAEALRTQQRETDREHAARQAAEAANRTKDEFLAMLSHELRAPLNTILGWASLLEAETETPPKIAKAVEAIARSARAQSKLIDDLLDVTQIVAEKLTVERSAVDLAAIVGAAMTSIAFAAQHRGVRLSVDIEPGSYSLCGDARRLEQLVTHLLSNAVKFSAPGGLVRVELSRRGTTLRLRVADEGIGISAQFLPHVFDRLRQHDGTRTRRHGGLGIGLTVAQRLTQLHGGTIAASSEGIGRGAQFVVSLPAADAGAGAATTSPAEARAAAAVSAAAPGAAAQPATLSGMRLLVVDDDEDARELLATLLEAAGATVATAASASEAVAAWRAAGGFDVLLSDLGMPDEDGMALLRRLRDGGGGGVPVVAVAVSGYGSSEDVALSREAGFAAHVVKPVEAAGLLSLVARLRR